ncbi:MAG: AMP-binding protein, partial [Porticoccaceae bacterium]|nr:AMP-binding protein [Porticoccaceae bacterium]
MSAEKLPLPLWQPTQEHIQNSNMYQFMSSVAQKHRQPLSNYSELYQWSITDPKAFWSDIWSYTEIRASKTWDAVLTDPDAFPGASWFSAARLNFAENLLRNRTDKIALISRLENGQRTIVTYAELYNQVAQCAAAMRSMGVTVGDRVAGFMPNVSQVIVAMLATTSIGAIWSSCSPDFGINGVMDRFGQIEPKLLFGCTGYYYNGKTIDSMPQLQEICDKINSIQKLVLVPIIEHKSDIANHKTVLFNDFLITKNTPELAFEQLPFDHPLYIMYSS